MNSAGRGVLLVYVGIVIGRITWSGSFGFFVQQRMRWPLAIAAACVFALGLVDVVNWWRERVDDRRSVGPVVGWLLAAPLLVLMSVSPTGLGAAASNRVDSFEPQPPAQTDTWALPADDPFEMRMIDFVNHALYDEQRRLEGRQVIMEGLVVNDPEVDDGFLLVRFVVSCCAADGLPLKVALRGTAERYDDDQWVRATVTWRPPDSDAPDAASSGFIEAEVLNVEPIDDPPSAQYESPY